MHNQYPKMQRPRRRGVTLLPAALWIFLALGLIAFAVDLSCIVLVRAQLQVAADSAAVAAAASLGLPREEMLAVAEEYAGHHTAGGKPVALRPQDVEHGIWDADTRVFTPAESPGNAVRVAARTDRSTGGGTGLLFSRIFNKLDFAEKASAVAIARPRDIAFVVDLSGSMNDDTEPAWATSAIDEKFASEGDSAVGSELMQQLYDDFGYGSFPGELSYLGRPWGVRQDQYAYAELTRNGGPLTARNVPGKHRIESDDDEKTRKRKAYSAIIDRQITRVMPKAKPAPDDARNYGYWEKYLDYVVSPCKVAASSPSSPADRGWIPPDQDSKRIDKFNNSNGRTSPEVNGSIPQQFCNRIGYPTYVQFMMDHGRDLRPVDNRYVPLSRYSRDCPWHAEATAGGTFRFPPRSQPIHAARRALIAAIQMVKQRNAGIANPARRDWVSIIVFDTLQGGGPVVHRPLTADYDAAMKACTKLQAVGDKGATAATEAGMIEARAHLRAEAQGGHGRNATDKVVVLLTGGAPNLYVSDPSEIDEFIAESGSDDFYGDRAYRYDGPLTQAAAMQAEGWSTFPVGVGRETDYDFMDRLSRLGGTAGDDGQSVRGSGNPADYEQRLTDIFRQIITNPKIQLVR